MAYRLIYTSSPSALVGARTGFCTVARSRDMSEKLASLVEKCGTYEHERAEGKPVFYHRKIFLGGEIFHILTRIAETAPDYTNRSNYIADHLVINSSELASLASVPRFGAKLLPIPTPAEIMLAKTDWHDSWTKEPQWLENETLPKLECAFLPPSKTWAEIFGDSGKAALLANSSPIIFAKPDDTQTLLKLFAESASLCASPMQAWDYTFTTALTSSDKVSDYNWKAVLNPSKDKIDATPSAINLINKSAPATPTNSAANFARTGAMSNTDRLGLKVAKPLDGRSVRIHVAKAEEEKTFSLTPILIASLVALIILAAAFIFVYKPQASAGGNTPSFQASANKQNADFAQRTANVEIAATLASYSQIRALIKDEIAKNNWQAAISTWENAKMESENPHGRAEILSDIGKRVDELSNDAEAILKSRSTRIDKAAVEKNLNAIKTALQLKDLPKKDERNLRFEELNKLAEKL